MITVNGRVNVAKNPADTCYGNTFPDDGKSYGPFGTGVSNWELLVGVALHDRYYNSTVGLGFINPSYGTSGPTQVSTDTTFAWHDTDVLVSRNGVGGSCENTGLYLLSGGQTLTVQEVSDDVLQLQAPAYVRPAGTQVTFIPKLASGQQITATLSWAWTPDAAPDSTKACPTGWQTCPTKVWKSGTMRVVGNILGKMREGKAHVTVYSTFTLAADKIIVDGGDTVTFTPEVDGAPGTAARWRWVPQDTSYHDATACTAGNQCKMQMLESGTMWAYLNSTPGTGDSASRFIQVNPKLSVNCDPSSMLRGSGVDCKVSIIPAQAITITQRQASGANFSILSEPNATVPRGQPYDWSGTAVASTTVLLTARLPNGNMLSGSGVFAVIPRPWPAWQQTTQPDSIMGRRGNMPKALIGAGTKAVLGNYELHDINSAQINATRVMVGPDSGLSYIVTQPSLAGADIYFHPDLLPGTAFYNHQDGIPAGTCNQSQMLTLWNEIRRHEGRTQAPNSHYGKTNEAFLVDLPQKQIEQLVSPIEDSNNPSSAFSVASDAEQAFYDWNHGAHHARQAAFDTADYPLIEQTLGCILDTSK